jgi:hypothetical protein
MSSTRTKTYEPFPRRSDAGRHLAAAGSVAAGLWQRSRAGLEEGSALLLTELCRCEWRNAGNRLEAVLQSGIPSPRADIFQKYTQALQGWEHLVGIETC